MGLAVLPVLLSALGLAIAEMQNSQDTKKFKLNNSNPNNSEIEENKVSKEFVSNDDSDNSDNFVNNDNDNDNDNNQVSQVNINNGNEVDNLPEDFVNNSDDENNNLHVNTELDNLKSELRLLGSKKHYLLGEKGKIYIPNPVREMNIENVSKSVLKLHLKILCVDTHIDSGKDARDNQRGWKQSPWEYFFVKSVRNSDMYEEIDNNYKNLLAKCIEFMYKNKDKSQKWNEYKNMCIEQMALHGGHCEWRAVAIINTVYDILTNYLRESGKIKSDNAMDDVFCELKDKMVVDAMDNFLKEHVNSHEPLDDVNDLVSGLRYRFNIPGGNVDDAGRRIVKKYIIKKMVGSFIRLSHEILDKFEYDKRAELMYDDMNTISFEEYCEYTMKTPEQIEKMLDKIWTSDTDESNELKQWIKNKQEVKLGEVLFDLGELFKGYEKGVVDEKDYSFGVRFLINCVKNDYLWLVDNDD